MGAIGLLTSNLAVSLALGLALVWLPSLVKELRRRQRRAVAASEPRRSRAPSPSYEQPLVDPQDEQT
jgi:hypothetical protein